MFGDKLEIPEEHREKIGKLFEYALLTRKGAHAMAREAAEMERQAWAAVWELVPLDRTRLHVFDSDEKHIFDAGPAPREDQRMVTASDLAKGE